jgi:mono/diheme cytochrome c family protein
MIDRTMTIHRPGRRSLGIAGSRWLAGAAVALLLAAGDPGRASPAPASTAQAASTAQDASSATPSGGSDGGSVRDGVYSAGQAARGRQIFQRTCTACHSAEEHTGRRFAGKWANTSLGDLFQTVSETMPEGEPGSLQPAEYASILAFFLRESGYPAGERELPPDVEALRKLRIEPAGPP